MYYKLGLPGNSILKNKNKMNKKDKITGLIAGAASVNITPLNAQFLFGYPFVERISKGVHDWLLCSALFLEKGENQTLLISSDVIFISKASTARIRAEITKKTGISAASIMVSVTHTHSGPITVDYVSSSSDSVVPKADVKYIRYMEDKIVEAACNAVKNATDAKVGFVVANATGVGTNRHDPSGPADMDVPAIIIKNINDEYIACMLVCNMHPTVLHEDSKLYSGDFPAYAREILQKQYFGRECPVVYFTGAAGNQSPRHVTKENTFAEASRIGGIIAKAVGTKINEGIEYSSEITVSTLQKLVDLPKRQFPDVEQAKIRQEEFKDRFIQLKKTSENTQKIRTAEVDWFGAEELLLLSKLAAKGELDDYYKSCLPAEIQVVKIGTFNFVAWPGEIFVEFALELKNENKNTFLITLSNGEFQGYIATKEAEDKGYYEASNTIFSCLAGEVLVKETIGLLKTIR